MNALALALCLAASASSADERLVLHTAQGDIVVKLYPGAAPKHVAQVVKLARLGAYDATPVAHVLRGYLVQFAGARSRRRALTREQKAALASLPLEAGGLPHLRGTLTMSRLQQDPDSAESSFSILLRDSPHLDGRYTAFARVESGWEALDALGALPVEGDDRPRHWTEITKAEVVPAARAEEASAGWPPPRGARKPKGELIWLLVAIVGLSAAGALADGKAPGRPLRAACLLNALLAFFAVLIATAPALPSHGWVPAVLFASALALFRLMAAFEPPA